MSLCKDEFNFLHFSFYHCNYPVIYFKNPSSVHPDMDCGHGSETFHCYSILVASICWLVWVFGSVIRYRIPVSDQIYFTFFDDRKQFNVWTGLELQYCNPHRIT